MHRYLRQMLEDELESVTETIRYNENEIQNHLEAIKHTTEGLKELHAYKKELEDMLSEND